MADKDHRKNTLWFSRRHETSEAHFAAQVAWQERHSAERVTERQAERATRTPQEQIAVLDRRLGVGQGAVRERAKLAALIGK